ncbi:MAG: TfoX/Sxy family protein [Clostridia bacterium]|nr:TfoX/Sxy family protein [Clostridia bacterium]
MASAKEYLDFILEQLAGLDGVTYRPMMGEYILYMHGKVVGGIYDDRLLVKPTASALAMLPEAERELPYEGAKEMLLVDRVDDREFLQALLTAMEGDLPQPRQKKKP